MRLNVWKLFIMNFLFHSEKISRRLKNHCSYINNHRDYPPFPPRPPPPIVYRRPQERFHELQGTHQNEALGAPWHCLGLARLLWRGSPGLQRWVHNRFWQMVSRPSPSGRTGQHPTMLPMSCHHHSRYRWECYSNLGKDKQTKPPH